MNGEYSQKDKGKCQVYITPAMAVKPKKEFILMGNISPAWYYKGKHESDYSRCGETNEKKNI
jgi:hypothetical protein